MYARAEDLMALGLMLQGSALGVSLGMIQERFAVSRRTAERLRDSALRAFPQMLEVPGEGRSKRWKLPPGTLSGLIAFTAAEFEELRLAEERLRLEGLPDRADALQSLKSKLTGLMRPPALARLEPDLEALLEAEGHAMRPGPHPQIAPGLLGRIRSAILGCEVLQVRYRKHRTGRTELLSLEPHGVLFGQRHYLVAYTAGRDGAIPKLYRLSNILSVEPSGRHFTLRKEFDLRSFASRAFGTFQETPVEVVWRFHPAAAADALEHHFHPSQQKRTLADGCVEVRFTAGGLQEMAWHLFTWGDGVEIVAPEALRTRYRELLRLAEAALGQAAAAP